MTAKEYKGNIMMVDDTPANLRLLGELLIPLGYEVRPFPVVTLCQYDVRMFSGAIVHGALKSHPDTLHCQMSRFLKKHINVSDNFSRTD